MIQAAIDASGATYIVMSVGLGPVASSSIPV